MSRKEILNNEISWKSEEEVHFSDVKVTGNLDMVKVKINGSIPDSGKIMKIGTAGNIEFDDPETLKGDKGDRGDEGPLGDIGPQGPQGPQGFQGISWS